MSGITGAVAGAVGLFKVPESCCTTEPDDPACQASVQVPLSGTVTGISARRYVEGGGSAAGANGEAAVLSISSTFMRCIF